MKPESRRRAGLIVTVGVGLLAAVGFRTWVARGGGQGVAPSASQSADRPRGAFSDFAAKDASQNRGGTTIAAALHRVRARVFKPDGNPCRSAKAVFIKRKSASPVVALQEGALTEEVPDGPLRVVVIPDDSTLGITYQDVTVGGGPQDIDIILREGATVRGVVLDAVGTPVAGAVVSVAIGLPAFESENGGSLFAYIDANLQGRDSDAMMAANPSISVTPGEVQLIVCTSKSGEFVFHRIPPGAVKVVASQTCGGQAETTIASPSPNDQLELRLPKVVAKR